MSQLTHARALELANQGADLSDKMKSVLYMIDQFLDSDADLNIDWSTPGAYINLDSDGNISGQQFSPAAMSNAIGSFVQIQNTLRNVAVIQGDHLGTLNALAKTDTSAR